MKRITTILFLATLLTLNIYPQMPVDTVEGCSAGFSYAITDSLMIYLNDGYELFLRSDNRDENVYHKWNLSNGLESGEVDPTFVINSSDSIVEVCHKIVGASGILCEHCEEIFHSPFIEPSCHANFTFYEDLTVNCNCIGAYQFIDQSYGSVADWQWTFGDGDTSYVQNPMHHYTSPGFYHIVLEIQTSDGCYSTMVKHLFIRSSDECDLKIAYDVLESFPPQYQFHTDLFDPRLPYSHIPPSGDSTWFNIIRYFWDFGDGIYSDEAFPGHVYKHSGEYTVKLAVTYADGFECTAELTDYFTGADLPGECNLTGTVRDYTGLDGCRYLIELDNGVRLEPILKDTTFHFRDNQRVRLSYIERTDLMSICMAGIIAEITCIKETEPDTVVPWPPCEQIMLNTSFSLNGGFCSGTASVEIITPCNAWMYYEMIMNTDYQILWSTGETTRTITGLCPGNLYFVNVTNPVTGKTYTAAFSIFQLNNVFPSWTFTKNENTYRFNLPIEDNYTVTWEFDDGISLVGDDVSYTFLSSGNHQVELVVKDNSGNEIYSETIQLSIPTALSEELSESTSVFPNPANDVLSVRPDRNAGETASFGIYNFSGQLLAEKYFSYIAAGNVINFDISDLKPGIYLLFIINGNGSSQSIKFEKH
jgi:PKD repeat protein